jgi:TPR repeat protein
MAAEQGDMPACVRLGLMYRCGNGVPRSSEEAVRRLTAAADRGYVPACCILAEMYELGDGVPRSKEMACEWYREAADNAGEEITRELIYEKIRNIKDAGRYARERSVSDDCVGSLPLPLNLTWTSDFASEPVFFRETTIYETNCPMRLASILQ